MCIVDQPGQLAHPSLTQSQARHPGGGPARWGGRVQSSRQDTHLSCTRCRLRGSLAWSSGAHLGAEHAVLCLSRWGHGGTEKLCKAYMIVEPECRDGDGRGLSQRVQ